MSSPAAQGDVRLERRLESLFRRLVTAAGAMTWKAAPTEAGIPDRVVAHAGHLYLVELKTDVGQLSPIQRHWHNRAAQQGIVVDTLYGEQQIRDWVATTIAAGDNDTSTPSVSDPGS